MIPRTAATAAIATALAMLAAAAPLLRRAPEPPSNWPARLNLNTASASTLDLLPGVGPKAAAAIVEHREKHGPFASPESVGAVPGIPRRAADRIARLTVAR